MDFIQQKKKHFFMQEIISFKMFIKKGSKISKDMITAKSTGTGIYPKNIDLVLGLEAKTDIQEDTVLKKKMFV